MTTRFRQCGIAYGVLVALLVANGPVQSDVRTLGASWERSAWHLDTAQEHCALTHDIPRFGRVRFEQRSGYGLGLSLYTDQTVVREQRASIISRAPPWKHQADSNAVGDFSLEQGSMPIQLPRNQAQRIYHELEQGMTPVIEFSDWGDGRHPVQVVLSPVRFREALAGFMACTGHLPQLGFDPLDEKTVYFSTDSDRLTGNARRALEEVARAWRSGRDLRVVLGGYADERGAADYNMRLSQKRARMVARYLSFQGIPSAAIESRYFGETRSQRADSNDAAWARNRRVTVWVAGKQ